MRFEFWVEAGKLKGRAHLVELGKEMEKALSSIFDTESLPEIDLLEPDSLGVYRQKLLARVGNSFDLVLGSVQNDIQEIKKDVGVLTRVRQLLRAYPEATISLEKQDQWRTAPNSYLAEFRDQKAGSTSYGCRPGFIAALDLLIEERLLPQKDQMIR